MTASRLLMATSGDGTEYDDELWPVGERTVIEEGETTPVVSAVCPDCGGPVLTDDFDLPSLAGFPSDRCVRGMFGRWWSCARLKRAVFYWG